MKNIGLCLILAIFSGCSSGDNACKTKESCITDQSCQCWCSRKCGFRAKEKTDNPIWVDNDENKKSCYCNQWDYINYVNNCIMGKEIKEPGK